MAAVEATDWAMDGTVIWTNLAEGRVARGGVEPETTSTGAAATGLGGVVGATRTTVFLAAAGAVDTFLEAALGFAAWGFLLAGAWVMVLTGKGGTALALGLEGVAWAVTFLACEEVLDGALGLDLGLGLDLAKDAAADLGTGLGAGLAAVLGEDLSTGL